MKMFAKLFVFVCLILCVSLARCATTVTAAVNSTGSHEVSSYVKSFGEENDTVHFNSGGDLPDFVSAAEDVLKTGRHVRIDGWCGSSCVIFADKARSNVCITDKAVFGFHMMSAITKVLVLSEGPSSRVELHVVSRNPMAPLSEAINKWVMDHGGFPYDGVPLTMNAEQASAFWPMCK